MLVEKQWYKVAFLVIMLYFSLIFTTVFLPIAWIHYSIPTTDYYLISCLLMFVGGVIFNIILSFKLRANREGLENAFPKGMVLKIFGWKFVAYSTVFFIMMVITGDIKPYLYYFLFLMIGGYSWFFILKGYIQATTDKQGKDEGLRKKSWLGRILFFSIILSLLLGYLYLYRIG
ncbi:hypothetical protein [Niallia circulans]|uniref:hypothetical protein n=1 Tax=Niallia circulans TaxID=1397 RepID=UPI00352CA4EC